MSFLCIINLKCHVKKLSQNSLESHAEAEILHLCEPFRY